MSLPDTPPFCWGPMVAGRGFLKRLAKIDDMIL